MNNKKTGSYYTPKPIADFMVKYIFNQMDDKNISILEPSVGDGVFIDSIADTSFFDNQNSLTLIEIDNSELLKVKIKLPSMCNIERLNTDFLKYQKNITKNFSLIIGNPPYINKKLLSTETIALCEGIHQKAKLSNKKINNIWTSFVVAGTRLLKKDGIMAFVLPSDILQVKYAEEIRYFLEKTFEKIEIFILEVSAFPKIEQQTVILIAYKKKKIKGTYFFKINNIEQRKIEQISSNGLMVSQKKWTHYNLDFDDIALLNKITLDMPKISDFVNISAGIVTGANQFFIQSKSIIDKYDLKKFALPILSKSTLLKQGIQLSKIEFNQLISNNKSIFLVSIKENDKLNSKQLEYIELGETEKLNTRYKCSLRKKWYCVPNISIQPEAIFFKRCHFYPRLIKNDANIFVTDTGYKVNTKKDVDIHSFIFSFYNIITLIYAELMGRKYGGGVLELTPNELKELPIIYRDIEKKEYNTLVKTLKSNTIAIKPNNNNELFKQHKKQLQRIYEKLIHGRIPCHIEKRTKCKITEIF